MSEEGDTESEREAPKDRSPATTASKIDALDRDQSISSDIKVGPDVLCITVKSWLRSEKLRKIIVLRSSKDL